MEKEAFLMLTYYRELSFRTLTSPQYRHIFLLLFWPLFGLTFYGLERCRDVETYIPMYCPTDDLIPFCEWFLIPYLFWFIFLIGIHVYTFFYDVPNFQRLMQFIMITYGITTVIFFVFPTCQDLRPAEFPRDNVLTRFMGAFYQFDTNTNVCPSLHVVGSLAVWNTARHCSALQSRGWRWFFCVSAVLISVSTVFLKQHSILDVLAALPLCGAAYWIVYKKNPFTA